MFLLDTSVIVLQIGIMDGPPDRKLYLGPRLRVLRRELGLNQTQMADELGISPSYLNHLERNQRPVTAQMLIRLTNAYDLDLREFVAGTGEASANDLQEILADRLVRDIGIPRHEVAEVAENHPGVAEAIVRLYRALGDLRRLPERIEQFDSAQHDAAPLDWLRAVLERRRNHFASLDAAAEALSLQLGTGPEALLAAIPARLAESHHVSVRVMPEKAMVGALRHYDFHRRRLMLAETLPLSGRLFAMAYHLAIEALAEPLAEAFEACGPAEAESGELLRIALANYAAAAIVMPYARFLGAAEESRYDTALLQARFGASLEQVAHRLTTLDRATERGVSFFMLKLDATGNVAKRIAVDQAPLPRFAGGCPRWDVQRAIQCIGEPVVSRIEHTNGARFVAIAIARRSAGRSAPDLIVLGCQEKYAARLGWADGLAGQEPIPVGIACNVCIRQDCPARTLPPGMRALDLHSYQRLATAYPFRAT
jgi:predicted transcriptional regulator/plasmid maintenance system antidote protein VapI